jgi:hypothetical protein
MKLFPLLVVLFSAGVASLAVRAQNQFFQSGSTGADGAFAPTTNNTNVLLPPDGRLNFTTVNIPIGVTVRFIRNAANTPVYLLATGAINIAGIIRVDGELGTATTGGRGGPGGFDGGLAGIAGSIPGDGLGPGAGRGALVSTNSGRGIYGVNLGTNHPALQRRIRPGADGSVYGSQLLLPLVGGSGGGGLPGLGGGGGGGAILIASSLAITNTGAVSARGAGGGDHCGSGGAIRLVAPLIAGTGGLDVGGGSAMENAGRIRCDLIERQQFGLTFAPASAPVTASEAFMVTFPPNIPSLRLISVAGVPVPPDAPAGFTVTLPFNAPAVQPIVLEASDFGVEVPVSVRLTPASGNAPPPIPATINNVAAGSAQITVNATFPPNVPVFVEAWTR